MNYLLVSHCSFNSNSCIQAYHILEVLVDLGWDCVISVPCAPDSIFDVFKINYLPFKVITYGTNELDGLFDDGRGADVIHAFTPRQHVRNETLRLADYFQAPYVVHMEDNEEEILRTELGIESVEDLIDLPAGHQSEHVGLWRIWPAYYRSFLSNAAGITALNDRLLESNFGHRPALVFWPGFDKRYLNRLDRQDARRRFDLPLEGHLLVYAGVVHDVNVDEVESLLLAVAELNRRGHQVYLVKAGNDIHPLFTDLPQSITDRVINLGFVNRVDLPQLLQSADVLVQPGMANPFNDYRFPSKLPEYFATGLPVVLPKTNIGLHVEDGVEALVLHEGHYRETADCIERLITNPGLAQQIGNAGREFALRELTWEKNARKIHDWLIEVLQNQPPPIAEKSFNIDSHQTSDPKLIAFYLPQFHPIPENNQWWGEGFTEWTNVKRGQPNFSGHYQPRLPADLGFYDLRDPEVMDQQAAIAQLYGIYGFCYYYYWFNGKRLLEHPLETMLARKKPDMPFCLCWANEHWTRRWDGQDKEILIAQNYDSGWVERFFKDILPYFQDERYIRVDGRPMLLLYRIEAIPDSTTTIQTWKQMARAAGLGGLHVVGVQYVNMIPEHPIKMGADATVEFPPHLNDLQHFLLDPSTLPGIHPDFSGYIEDYSLLMRQFLNRSPVNIPWYRGVMPGWDNTARRRMQSHVYVNSSPKLYELWLQYLVDYSRCAPNGQPLIFVNAWNEWAEGAYLEPDQKYGWEYLEATSRALRGYVPIRDSLPYQPIGKSLNSTQYSVPAAVGDLAAANVETTTNVETAVSISVATNITAGNNITVEAKKEAPAKSEFFLATPGRCPLCASESKAQFVAHHPWLRDSYLCKDCGTCPRQRSMALLLEQLLPNWRQLSIHEGSPCIPYYDKACFKYTCSYYFSHIAPGEFDPATGLRCEDFEALTFPDDTFDIFMHQDVLEHVFNPHKAVREAMRVLKPGGLHIFTAPKNKLLSTSEPRAALENGQVNYLKPAEYHIDPKDSEGVLVTWDYGADFDDLLSAWSGYLVNTHIMRDRRHGVDGDYLEVFYSWKTPENKLTSEERVAILKSWPYGTQYLSLL
jgi:glycosyltransferase involved in cell wall biosynthesis/SAM-dependent methyltransferase